jgi:hypothetical protein
MTFLVNAVPSYVAEKNALPRAPIRESDLVAIAGDQAHVFEFLTSRKSSTAGVVGSADTVTSYQRHDGDKGALLQIPLGHANLERSIIRPSQILTTAEHKIILRFPFFAPGGVSSVQCLFDVEGNDGYAPAFSFYVLDTTFAVTDYGYFAPSSPGEWRAQASCTAGAVNICSIEADLSDDMDDLQPGGLVIVSAKWAQNPEAPSVTRNARASAAVYSDYQKIASNAVVDGYSLNAYALETLAANDAMLFEALTGTPATGHTSLTATAHTHNGANSQHIDFPLFAVGLGWACDNDGGLLDDKTQAGYNGFCPSITSATTDTYFLMADQTLQVPDRSTKTLSWAAVVYDDGGEGGTVRASLRDAISTLDASYSDTDTWAASSAGWKYLTGSFDCQSDNTEQVAAIEMMKDTHVKSSPGLMLTGACMWMVR